MRFLSAWVWVLLFGTVACTAAATKEAPSPALQPATAAALTSAPAPELADRRDAFEELHGLRIPDPYRWLEDEGADAVKAFMAAHDAFAREQLAAYPSRDAYLARLKELAYVDSRSAPKVRGSRTFWSEKASNREKSIHYWSEADGNKRVLLDPLALSPDGTLAISSVVPNPDGSLVAYLERPDNADESTLKIIRVETGEVLENESIPGLRYTRASWAPDGRAFYYTWLPSDPTIPTNQKMGYGEIRRHDLGTDPKDDRTLREKTGDPSRWVSAEVSEDGRWLIATVSRGWSETAVYVQDLSRKKPEWVPLSPKGSAAIYDVVGYGPRLYVRTNEGASRYRVFSVRAGRYNQKHWKEIIPERAASVVDGFTIVGQRLVVHALHRAASKLETYSFGGKKEHEIKLPGLGSVASLEGKASSDVLYVGFAGFDRPPEVWKTSVMTGATELYYRTEVPLTPGALTVDQVRYPSKDGTEVSMFIVRRPDAKPDGKQPTLLYGYGGFNISLTPRFTPLVVAWVEAGGVYAMPNLRGGGEYGEDWHKAGMLENKQNVFDDFVAAAEYLVSSGWTSVSNLGIYGRSNGGLLVGAAMTQRPDLFQAVVCGVPLLDMVRYHQFGIGRAWIPEYGTSERPEDLEWLLAYSPYHRVAKGSNYPALLMLSADHDDRVDPLHARKFVAQVRWATVGERPILLRIESNSGHGGGDLRSKWVARTADQLGFLHAELRRTP